MSTSSKEMLRTRMTQYFGAHGRFCASHPWEVIVTIVTLTVCALSMSVLSGGKVGTVCGIQKPCQPTPTDQDKSDTVMLSIVNSLAVIYIYNQFSSLRKAGSKYLLAIAGLFTIFSSFVFGSTVVNFIDEKVSGLNEALPFFLLLIDLSKASALAKFAFKSRTKEEVHANIGKGIAMLGPTMTLDTVVEVLLISIGTISGVPQFETICCFGCMSLIANYLVFMTFFPASLALVLEVCPYDPGNHSWHLDELARAMQEEEKKPNPVVQRVKIIMALGLLVVHVHSRFLSSVTGLSFGFSSSSGDSVEASGEVERVSEVDGDGDLVKVPLPDYLWWKVFHLTADQLVTIGLAVLLFVKYIFFDKSKNFPTSMPPTPAHTRNNSRSIKASPSPTSNSTASSCPFSLSQVDDGSVTRRRTTSGGLNINVDLPKPVRRHASGPPEEMEKILNGGMVIRDLRSETSATRNRPALEGPDSQQSMCNQENTDGGKIGQALKIEDKLSRADFLLGKPTCVSVGVQTDPLPDGTTRTPKQSMFSIGAPSSDAGRKDSMVSSPDSGIGNGPLDEDTRNGELIQTAEPRPVSECLNIFKSDGGATQLSDAEILQLVKAKHIPAYKLETAMGDPERGVSIRRQLVGENLATSGHPSSLDSLPYTNYNYSLVSGACCENVIGYMPIPVGYAGPLLLDGQSFHVPMSTTEGALVASTNRGCRAVGSSGGVKSSILGDGMTRGPVVRLPSAAEAASVKVWLDDMENFSSVAESFNSTSRFARLKSLQTAVAGRLVYIRFKATTGDAMGMNMLSKGVEKAIHFVQSQFPGMEVISLSGNFCTDKKPAAINWLGGRGKSVVCEATIPAQVVKQVLKTSVDALVDLNISKNLVGSAMAGSMGGFNAHAANIVSAIFIATGQDPAQNVASSNCITLMERSGAKGEDLYISCTMPSIEIGTVGGGTILPPQSACLAMLGVQGAHKTNPGENASQLARIVCATVLAGELSLLSALAAGHLVKSHLTHNRSQLNLASIPEGSSEPKDHRRTHSDTESMRATPSHATRQQSSPSVKRRGSVQLQGI